ncbi:MAG: Fic family protein [Bdellovibrionales bacterium]|nr:Fic family protein [Bdellovibrionales bacterium]
MNPRKPYNNLPKLPPKLKITSEIGLKCSDARAALAELKGAINIIPNPAVLINTIPLLETHSSNQIENVVTTQDNLFRFSALDRLADPATKEALRYRTALRRTVGKPISISLMEEICSIIKNKDINLRSKALRIANERKETVYIPPDDKKVIHQLLTNWIKFADNSNIDPLVQMAVLHYQFEAIHPFPDGNGRTGRILNLLFLVQKKLLDLPILYLSRYILENRTEYYTLLKQVTEQKNWSAWVLYMLSAVKQTSVWTLHHIQSVKKLMDHTKKYIKETLNAPHYRGLLLEVLFTYPYCRSYNLQELGIKSPITSRKYLRQLVDLGILKEEKVGKELVFIHEKYLKLLMNTRHTFDEYQLKQ